MGPEIFKIFLQHVVVNIHKISNHSEVVMFWLGEMVWNASQHIKEINIQMVIYMLQMYKLTERPCVSVLDM